MRRFDFLTCRVVQKFICQKLQTVRLILWKVNNLFEIIGVLKIDTQVRERLFQKLLTQRPMYKRLVLAWCRKFLLTLCKRKQIGCINCLKIVYLQSVIKFLERFVINLTEPADQFFIGRFFADVPRFSRRFVPVNNGPCAWARIRPVVYG